MKRPNSIYRTISKVLLTLAILDFMSGEFVFSTIVFSLASLGLIGK